MNEEDRAPWWEPYSLCREPIKVQGVTVKPGERVVVACNGVEHSMVYKGWSRITSFTGEEIDGYWMLGEPSTGPVPGPGPYRLEELRHPSLLDGIISEIDAAD